MPKNTVDKNRAERTSCHGHRTFAGPERADHGQQQLPYDLDELPEHGRKYQFVVVEQKAKQPRVWSLLTALQLSAVPPEGR